MMTTSNNQTMHLSNGVLHVWRNGRLDYCSAAEPWTDETGCGLDWGNCPHYDDPEGGPAIVAMRQGLTSS